MCRVVSIFLISNPAKLRIKGGSNLNIHQNLPKTPKSRLIFFFSYWCIPQYVTSDHHVIIHGCCLVILLLHSFFCFQTTGLVAFLVVSKSKSLTVCNSQYCFQCCSTEWWSAELADCLDSPLISAGFQVMWLFQVSWHNHKLKWLLFNNKKNVFSLPNIAPI